MGKVNNRFIEVCLQYNDVSSVDSTDLGKTMSVTADIDTRD